MASKAPVSVSVRAYQVGFGDCFLLTFVYPSKKRHVLIDCGSTGAPKSHPGGGLLMRVARDIEATCVGKLEAVVATHRHADHINGFARGTKEKPASGDVLRSLRPELVVQPWTEDPGAAPDARVPTAQLPEAQAFVRALGHMHRFSEHLLDEIDRPHLQASLGKRALAELRFLGEDNLSNKSAVENLMSMARDPKGQRYVNYGVRSGLEDVLPGVRVHVLGPPTVAQSSSITKQRAHDEAEFWHLMAGRAGATAIPSGNRMFGGARVTGPVPAYARWLVPRIRDLRGEQLRQLVRTLDAQMNNTSVILVFEVGKQRLLFPGDAQIENWMDALKGAPPDRLKKTNKVLAATTLYKVGHHGSLNATPKTLWNLFNNRAKTNTPRRLISIVSSMAGKHGHADDKTEVPRRTLIDALKAESNFMTTQDIRSTKELSLVVSLGV